MNKKIAFFFFYFLCLFFSFVFGKNECYELAVCTIFQNDAKYIPEWIEFHSSQGVEHFFLYNNLSEDDYQYYLDPYIKIGLVEVIDWPYLSKTVQEWNIFQRGAYMDCVNKNRQTCRWIAFLDTDEFLFSPQGKDLRKVLKTYKKYAGVGVNWMMYGTSFVEKIPFSEKMTAHLVKRAPADHQVHKHVKSIVQPQYVLGCSNPHFFQYIEGKFSVTEKKVPFNGPFSSTPSHQILRINHYWSRDLDFFLNVKCERRKKRDEDCQQLFEMEADFNAIYDPLNNYVDYQGVFF